MKKIAFLTAIAVSLSAGVFAPAQAADMAASYKAPVIASPATNWSGFYVGINGGGGVVAADFQDPCFSCADRNINASAATFGGTAGYNWQYRAMVFGVEGDFNWLSANKTAPNATDDGGQIGTATNKMNAFATIRGRMGLAYENALVYVTAGAAFAHVNSNVALCASPLCGGGDLATSTDNAWLPGIAVGAGAEYQLTANLSLKGEFLYMLFKDDTTNYVFRATGVPVTCLGTASCGPTYSYNTAVARLGLNWKLGAL